MTERRREKNFKMIISKNCSWMADKLQWRSDSKDRQREGEGVRERESE
jgi:hypothetical protein